MRRLVQLSLIAEFAIFTLVGALLATGLHGLQAGAGGLGTLLVVASLLLFGPPLFVLVGGGIALLRGERSLLVIGAVGLHLIAAVVLALLLLPYQLERAVQRWASSACAHVAQLVREGKRKEARRHLSGHPWWRRLDRCTEGTEREIMRGALCPDSGSGIDKKLLTQIADNGGPSGPTLLHHAARCSREATHWALAQGILVDGRAPDGTTALMHAVDVETARVLLESRADVNARDAYGRTPLMLSRSYELSQLLLDHGADVAARDDDGYTALMLAHTEDLAKVLLNAHIDVHATDGGGNTALHYARSAEHFSLLLAAGAHVDARNRSEQTPLLALASETCPYHVGCQPRWSVPAANVLLRHGADVNATDGDGNTPLLLRAERDDDLAALLAAQPHVNAVDRNGKTALLKAIARGHYQAATQLLDAQADPALADPQGESALSLIDYEKRTGAALPLPFMRALERASGTQAALPAP